MKTSTTKEGNNMTIFTTRSARQARRAMFDFIGAIILAGAGLVLMLAYFDVLAK